MIVTTEEAAEIAGVTAATIRQWVVRGDLEPVRRGAKPLRFQYDDVARVQADKRPKAWRQRLALARLAMGAW
ncbi:helix-turn-helix domain-containing protein [Nocardioides sp. NPDC101246]|uniref:helix-turn-helix domain-containing protein n=1 Tax=Nocardioides sp. NPDC101246 TaxID=3364336 RepID=UPI0037F86E85